MPITMLAQMRANTKTGNFVGRCCDMRYHTMTEKNKSSKPGWFTGDVVVPGPGSENHTPVVVPGSMKPVDVESLPLKDRAVLEVLTEKSEKAHAAGIENPEIRRLRWLSY